MILRRRKGKLKEMKTWQWITFLKRMEIGMGANCLKTLITFAKDVLNFTTHNILKRILLLLPEIKKNIRYCRWQASGVNFFFHKILIIDNQVAISVKWYFLRKKLNKLKLILLLPMPNRLGPYGVGPKTLRNLQNVFPKQKTIKICKIL